MTRNFESSLTFKKTIKKIDFEVQHRFETKVFKQVSSTTSILEERKKREQRIQTEDSSSRWIQTEDCRAKEDYSGVRGWTLFFCDMNGLDFRRECVSRLNTEWTDCLAVLFVSRTFTLSRSLTDSSSRRKTKVCMGQCDSSQGERPQRSQSDGQRRTDRKCRRRRMTGRLLSPGV